MRIAIVLLALLAVCAVNVQADEPPLTLLVDFNAYDLGTINLQGETTDYGFPIHVWSAQANTSNRRDSGYSNVVEEGPDDSQCIKLTNRGTTGGIDTVYTCMYLGDQNSIYDTGTIYMQFSADGPNDCIVGGNDLWPGYMSDEYNSPTAGDDNYQDTGNWGNQAMLWRMSGGEEFRAYDSGTSSYYNVAMGQQANQWQELWIQVDCENKLARYYVCPLGGTPAVVVNPGDSSEWWGWRNQSRSSIMNIKWLHGMYPFPDANIETNVLIDNIAVNTTEYTLARIGIDPQPDPHPGDANDDGTVNLDDFIILKQHYGQSPADWADGDFNDDDVVNLDDFIILKQNYGWSEAQ